MLRSVCFGTNHFEKAVAFYDAVLATIGMVRLKHDDVEAGYGQEGETPVFWVIKPYNEKPATFGNGSQVQFVTSDPSIVDQFYAKAIELGGADEGPPGPRSYTPGYYGAYCRDLDGNKLHIAHIPE